MQYVGFRTKLNLPCHKDTEFVARNVFIEKDGVKTQVVQQVTITITAQSRSSSYREWHPEYWTKGNQTTPSNPNDRYWTHHDGYYTTEYNYYYWRKITLSAPLWHPRVLSLNGWGSVTLPANTTTVNTSEKTSSPSISFTFNNQDDCKVISSNGATFQIAESKIKM